MVGTQWEFLADKIDNGCCCWDWLRQGVFLHLLSLEGLFTIGHLVDKMQDVVRLRRSKMFFSQRNLCTWLTLFLNASLRTCFFNQFIDYISVHGFGWSKETMHKLMLCKLYHLTSTQYIVESSLRTIWLFINKY